MSVLFGKRKKAKVQETTTEQTKVSITTSKNSKRETEKPTEKMPQALQTFEGLGISAWLAAKCGAIGIRRPTPVQSNCIPPILEGRDVIGCAQTGSGKTAAFALPILHVLSKDPYGPFAVVMTPTRELAFQISEQFEAFGSSISLRTAVIVGGVDMLKQALELDQRPHIIVATPGRLRDHLMRSTPPDLSHVRFVVLDECDRLLEDTFASDLGFVLDKCPSSNRQMLLFSATMNENLRKIEDLMDSPFRFDATPTATTVSSLEQKYLFIPKQIKPCYLVKLVESFGPSSETRLADDAAEGLLSLKRKRKKVEEEDGLIGRSMIIFVSSCKMCQLVGELLKQLDINSVTLHSVMSQNRRLASLGKFKSGLSKILVCTDVASRGLDIPTVDVVVNYDMPRQSADYIHRVGRTARAGKNGLALSFVTQYDIELVQSIEEAVEIKMEEYELEEAEVLKRINDVTTAMRLAKMKLMEYGFDEKIQRVRDRKKGKAKAKEEK